MDKWELNKPIMFDNFNKFEKLDKIKADFTKKQNKYLSLLLDGKRANK